jgi:hypothetical protein
MIGGGSSPIHEAAELATSIGKRVQPIGGRPSEIRCRVLHGPNDGWRLKTSFFLASRRKTLICFKQVSHRGTRSILQPDRLAQVTTDLNDRDRNHQRRCQRHRGGRDPAIELISSSRNILQNGSQSRPEAGTTSPCMSWQRNRGDRLQRVQTFLELTKLQRTVAALDQVCLQCFCF